MVSHAKTTSRYRGQMASSYVAKRSRQQRWHMENAIVAEYLALLPRIRGTRRVLDCPVGTGRFLSLYRAHYMRVVGVDSSEEMLEQACALYLSDKGIKLQIGDAMNLPFEDREFHLVVCVRFLDLLAQEEMVAALLELARCASQHVILTIRLGPRYVPKSNTATHDENRFLRLVTRTGFSIWHDREIFNQGWHVLLLKRIGRVS